MEHDRVHLAPRDEHRPAAADHQRARRRAEGEARVVGPERDPAAGGHGRTQQDGQRHGDHQAGRPQRLGPEQQPDHDQAGAQRRHRPGRQPVTLLVAARIWQHPSMVSHLPGARHGRPREGRVILAKDHAGQEVGVATGPWDTGGARFLASDADRERTVDVLKTAFVHGALTRDELACRTSRALTARTYADLAASTAGLTPGAPRHQASQASQVSPASHPMPRRRVNKKVVAWSTAVVVVPVTLSAAFLNYYGGFLVIMLFMFIGAVLLSKPPAPPKVPLAKSIGGKH
jgi:hypothetical protein